jgi:predicted phage baseplate assembly protein
VLSSGSEDPHYVVEIDDRGMAHLRFGDGELGRLPAAGDAFAAIYRVGNGPAGNVGAEAISHIVSDEIITGISLEPRNPLPARGGTAPEPADAVKLVASHAFRRELQRAITPDDYAALVERDFSDRVHRSAAVFRWTGSWYEVLVAVDASGTSKPEKDLLEVLRHCTDTGG